MTVEIPELLRRAMELKGIDADAVAAKAAEIADTLGEPEALTGVVAPAEADPDQLTLSDPDVNTLGAFHGPEAGAPDTSRVAAIDVYPRTGTQRRAVLDYIAHCGEKGATDGEIRMATGVRRARTRRHELVDGGWVEDARQQRKLVDTENLAEVWVLTPAGRTLWRPASYGYERDDG